MMTLQPAEHGFTCVMSGRVDEADIQGYLEQARRMLPTAGSFGLLVDQRECRVLDDGAQAAMGGVMAFFKSRGLGRVAIVCSSAVLAMQMNRLAAASPVGASQLALDGKSTNWRAEANSWITKGIRPAHLAKAESAAPSR